MIGKLGHFELLEEIGRGKMATDYKAYDPTLNRLVAIRLLDENLAHQDPQFVESFIHEAQNAASINHPNIVPIYFVGEQDGNYYFAMELLEGRSLDQVIREEGPQSEEAVLKIGIQIAGALRASYVNQMVHGDIKPQNIFITNRGIAKLLDFGLAKMANIESASEIDESAWGSAYYISPERVGNKAEDFQSDMYSLGATLFHALVGHPPFDADTLEDLALKRLNEKAPALRRMNPAISTKTEQIVARMLNTSAFLRYLDYDRLIEDLRASVEPSAAKQHAGVVNIPRPQPDSPIIIAPKAPTVGMPQKPNLLPLVITCVTAGLVLCAGIIFLVLQSNKVDSTRAAASVLTAVPNTPAPVTTYALTTTNGNAGGKYAAGTLVTATATAAGGGYQFSRSSGTIGALANPPASSTTLTGPSAATSIAATYSLIAATTVISDDFSQPNNDTGSHTPYSVYNVRIWDGAPGGRGLYPNNGTTPGNTVLGTNLPGGTWQFGGGNGTDYSACEVGSLAGYGATNLTLTGGTSCVPYLNVQNNENVAISLGSYNNNRTLAISVYVAPRYNPAYVGFDSVLNTANNFSGLKLDTAGGLSLIVNGSQVGSTVAFTGSFSRSTARLLTFSVNTATGAMCNVSLQGSTSTYNFSTTAFTPAETAYAALYSPSNSGGGAQFAYFNVTANAPEIGDKSTLANASETTTGTPKDSTH